ncbi:Glucose-6-phosphate isomerase [Mycoplasmopsis californica]|uniref:Glucose-6-phosphate isomerase n=1 Tax=Mycoplasmopsis equigenitalium TaxID=114883 RepID=A0ABY5J2H7_9BACT|nr:glucose-6-phosphate isomerase [Mycoplasmopsis equigenitalium]UUD37200.1 glucose-6-phosphate isomerase [Mycoplasmopsis equigenitalium]VEU69496.1 Glucose-6-phosphate isomerase [Mycoplasmopsis californica]
MKMLNLDLSTAIDEDKVLEHQEQVNQIHKQIVNKTGKGNAFLGWCELVNNYDNDEFKKIKAKAKEWQKNGVEVIVSIGIGGSYLGIKAAYEYLYGQYATQKPKIELLFAGNSISSYDLINKLKYVEDKKFAINVISKSGTTLEPSIAFREFRKLLEAKIGEEEAKDFIVATTDKAKGVLFDLATKKGYTKFVIPDDVGGRFSILTPVGLFPLACAGVDIDALMQGAKEAQKVFSNPDLKLNDSYKYAVTRFLLGKKYKLETLVTYEPNWSFLSEWWKQLFAESEGKEGKGLLPYSLVYSTDLHSLGQFVQEGSPILFETIFWLEKPRLNFEVKIKESEDIDKLFYLNMNNIHNINKAAYEATRMAHYKNAGIPNLVINIKEANEASLGWIFMFFEWALAMSAYMLGVNPFDQPGVEVYKTNMFKILKGNK